MEQIGRFKILGELGRGAMGVVYKAEDQTIGRVVALKSIRLQDLTDESERARLRDRLMREARSAGMLSHPGIITIYDTLEEGDCAYIVMECVNGPTFEKMLDTGISADQLLDILRQTAVALDYAHAQGIVHRDIKPGNIMVNETGRAKIADFGVARIMSQQLTQSGAILGTPNYMAPEQIQGLPVDGRADQFALTVIAFEALTGERPFSGDTIATLLFKITREEPSPASLLNSSLSPAVDKVLQRGFSKKAPDRFPNCTSMVEALITACRNSPGWAPLRRGIHSSLPTVVKTTPGPEPLPALNRPEPAARRTRYFVMAVLVGILLLAGIAYQFRSVPGSDPIPDAPTTPQEAPAASVDTPAQESPTPAVPAVPAVPTGPVMVPVDAKPDGSRVVADNDPALACTVPCSLTLLPGRHVMVVSHAGYRDIQRAIEVPAESEVNATLELITGVLTLNTTPPGLSVVIDGQEQATKTPLSATLPAGDHRVQVVNGTQRQDFTVQIRDGGITSKTIEWQ